MAPLFALVLCDPRRTNGAIFTRRQCPISWSCLAVHSSRLAKLPFAAGIAITALPKLIVARCEDAISCDCDLVRCPLGEFYKTQLMIYACAQCMAGGADNSDRKTAPRNARLIAFVSCLMLFQSPMRLSSRFLSSSESKLLFFASDLGSCIAQLVVLFLAPVSDPRRLGRNRFALVVRIESIRSVG